MKLWNTFLVKMFNTLFDEQDSLVFGGNFLHSFGIARQLKIAEVENVTHVSST